MPVIDIFTNKQIKSEIEFNENDIWNGFFVEYFEQGSVKTKGFYINDKKNGLFESFSENDALLLKQEMFENGNLIKVKEYQYLNDIVKSIKEEDFNLGIKLEKVLYENGLKEMEINYSKQEIVLYNENEEISFVVNHSNFQLELLKQLFLAINNLNKGMAIPLICPNVKTFDLLKSILKKYSRKCNYAFILEENRKNFTLYFGKK